MSNQIDENELYEGDEDSVDQNIGFTEYDISASPNDFNVRTLFDFIDSGIVKIPGFQRNFVWDLKRASKLIESLLIGIPIPQIFLYEESKNNFLVIDGQQRYFTIYFFKKKRFPRIEKRFELRGVFNEQKGIPDNVLSDNKYFVDFNLQLPELLPDKKNKYNGLNYSTLSDPDRNSVDLRTIRNVIIKQNAPQDGDTVVFEIFNRLNSGGVNLKPQEIRTSLYHSKFYDMLYKVNMDSNWRLLTPQSTPDLNMKDIEILLRGFGMLLDRKSYKPSLTKFLNAFSAKAKKLDDKEIEDLESMFHEFSAIITELDQKVFYSKTGKFNISIFEAIFVALCFQGYADKSFSVTNTTIESIERLKNDEEFVNATQSSTASSKNVKIRIDKAMEYLINESN